MTYCTCQPKPDGQAPDMPAEDCPVHNAIYETCPACEGSGEVGFNRSWDNDPQCEETAVCSACGGDGTI